VRAAQAAECGRQQGAFRQVHDHLFDRQAELTSMDFNNLGSSLGLDTDRFATCLDGQMISQISRDESEGRRLGVSGTPAFFIGSLKPDNRTVVLRKKIIGSVPFEVFERELEIEIARTVKG